MIRYTLKGFESLIHNEWTLTEYVPGEDPQTWREQNLSASEATEWANRCLGQFVELDWQSADGSVLSLNWTATREEIDDNDGHEVLS